MQLRVNASRPVVVLLGVATAALLIAGTAAAQGLVPSSARVQLAADAPSSAPRDEPVVAADGEPAAAAVTPPAPPSTTVTAAAPATLASVSPRRVPPTKPSTTNVAAAATTPSPPAPVVIRTPGAIANPPSIHGILIGPGAWTSTFEGITTTLRMAPAAPRVGEVVHFSVTTRYPGIGCCIVFFYNGESFMSGPDVGASPCAQGAPSMWHREFDHTYTTAGVFGLTVHASPMPCTPPPPGPGPENAHLYADITVGPAA